MYIFSISHHGHDCPLELKDSTIGVFVNFKDVTFYTDSLAEAMDGAIKLLQNLQVSKRFQCSDEGESLSVKTWDVHRACLLEILGKLAMIINDNRPTHISITTKLNQEDAIVTGLLYSSDYKSKGTLSSFDCDNIKISRILSEATSKDAE